MSKRSPVYAALSGLLLLMALGIASRCSAQAPQSISGDRVGREIIGYFADVSGYWFSSGSATRALGTPKFGGDSTFYVKPAHRYHVAITGGFELVGASDHWLPFSGGNSFSLTGGSVQIGGDRGKVGRLVPYLRAGLFAGHVRSKMLNFDKTEFATSTAFGAEMKIHRYVTISARYRISSEVAGINTDGFSAGIHIF